MDACKHSINECFMYVLLHDYYAFMQHISAFDIRVNDNKQNSNIQKPKMLVDISVCYSFNATIRGYQL